MKYSLKTNNYCNFNVFEVNKLEARNYAIPYADKNQAADVDLLKEIQRIFHNSSINT